MARPLRVNVAGGWYHVTNRGQNRQNIFLRNEDRLHFLDVVGKMAELFGVDVRTVNEHLKNIFQSDDNINSEKGKS